MGTSRQNQKAQEAKNEIEITHGTARCRINPARGGLITSWMLPSGGQPSEIVWSSDTPPTSGWPDGGIPLMFPFAGRVWDQGEVGFYRTTAGRFPMDMHGFLYDQKLTAEILGASKVRLTGAATAQTKAKYPWNWELEVIAELLSASSLQLSLHVRHVGAAESPMPIALGVHPFWQSSTETSIHPDRTPAFRSAAMSFQQVENGRAGKEEMISPPEPIPLTDPRLRSGIFSKLTRNYLEFDLPDNRRLISEWSEASGIQHVVLWSNTDAGYFCPEPWMGLPDAVHAKTGCRWLKSGEAHTCQFTFSVAEQGE